jgi:exosortase
MLAAFVWSYWPALGKLVSAWESEPDYSHGYFVLPLALFFLYARRDTFPGWSPTFAWPGVALIVLSIGVRMFGARYYVDAIDAWSMLFWVAGVVWLLGGWRVLWWSAPSIAFLWFMIPLPWKAERLLSLPLQRIATKLSCWTLQCLGQPALYEGNVIHIEDYQLEVAQACSGLRIFVGIIALAFAYIVLVKRSWWERGLLLLSVIPIALIANSARIVATGLLNRYVSGEAAHKFTHDVSGYVMIPFAAGLFALVLWYVGKLTREVELVGVGEVVRGEAV